MATIGETRVECRNVPAYIHYGLHIPERLPALSLESLALLCSTWAECKGWGTLTNFYTRIFDALYPICNDCLFLVEGSGQVRLVVTEC